MKAFRRLARRCEPDLLYRVAKADSLGRMHPGSHVNNGTTLKRRSGLSNELGAGGIEHST